MPWLAGARSGVATLPTPGTLRITWPLAEGRRWHLLAQLSDESAPAAVEHDLPGHIAYRSHPAAGRLPAWSVLVSIESP